MRFVSFLLTACSFLPVNAQENKPAANHFYYSPAVLNDLGYLGTIDEIAAFFDFKQGDRIADIGGESGEYSCILSLLFDNVHFTVEDIDKKKLSQKKLDKNIAKFSKIRKAPQNCTFDFVIGTLMTTNLKDSSYDVLFLKSSFHEIGFVEEMIEDMGRKLKPGGKIIVMDVFSTSDKSVYCKDGHRGYTIKEACILMEHHDFRLTAMRSPGSDVPNYANTLVFERNTDKSRAFLRGLYGTTPIESQIKRLSMQQGANDSAGVKLLCDSIKIQFTPLQNNYACFETWLTGFGIMHFENKNYAAARNVFNLVKELYPKSYQAWYWMAEVYREQGRYEEALKAYKSSSELNPGNSDCNKRMLECVNRLGEKKQK